MAIKINNKAITSLFLEDKEITNLVAKLDGQDKTIYEAAAPEPAPLLAEAWKGLAFYPQNNESEITIHTDGREIHMLYSLDFGNNWEPWIPDESVTIPHTGMWVQCWLYPPGSINFSISGPTYARGTIMTLLDSVGERTDIPQEGQFRGLFKNCSDLLTAPELPATELSYNCYESMFENCTSLTIAPVLPSTWVPAEAYKNMFKGCSSLCNVTLYADSTDEWFLEGFLDSVADCGVVRYRSEISAYISIPDEWVSTTPSKVLLIEPYNPEDSINLTRNPYDYAPVLFSQDGQNWHSTEDEDITQVSIDAKGLYLKLQDLTYALEGETLCIRFSDTEIPVRVSGDLCSMVFGDNKPEEGEEPQTQIYQEHIFEAAFMAQPIVDAHDLTLSALTLTEECYSRLFEECENLKFPPRTLPASHLAEKCYRRMFYGCVNMLFAPVELPARMLEQSCYESMFEGCHSFRIAPWLSFEQTAPDCCSSMLSFCYNLVAVQNELPATTLEGRAYLSMFCHSTSLRTAPVIRATNIGVKAMQSMFEHCSALETTQETFYFTEVRAEACYSMFSQCTSLKKSPAINLLPNYHCYTEMFAGASKLRKVTVTIPEGQWPTDASELWLSDVSLTGKFYCYADLQIASGESGIPEGWTRVDL